MAEIITRMEEAMDNEEWDVVRECIDELDED